MLSLTYKVLNGLAPVLLIFSLSFFTSPHVPYPVDSPNIQLLAVPLLCHPLTFPGWARCFLCLKCFATQHGDDFSF